MMYAREVLGAQPPLPRSELAASTLVRLPLFPELAVADAERIAATVTGLCLE